MHERFLGQIMGCDTCIHDCPIRQVRRTSVLGNLKSSKLFKAGGSLEKLKGCQLWKGILGVHQKCFRLDGICDECGGARRKEGE